MLHGQTTKNRPKYKKRQKGMQNFRHKCTFEKVHQTTGYCMKIAITHAYLDANTKILTLKIIFLDSPFVNIYTNAQMHKTQL